MSFIDSLKSLIGIAPPKSEEEIALWRAVGENRADLSRRLALAKYLEAKQDPLGKFIRLSLERDKLPPDDPRYAELDNQAGELLDKYGKRWVRPFKSEMEIEPRVINMYFPGLWFERGMIEELTVDRRSVVPGKLERAFEIAPALRKISLARCSPDWSAIASSPLMAKIEALDISEVKASVADLQLLASSPHLANLTELNLSDKEHGADVAKVVANAKHWKKLRELNLASCRIGPEGAALLAGAAHLASVEDLDLAYCRLGDAGIEALTKSPHLKNLKVLNLHSNEITSQGAAALAAAGWKLKELDIASNQLGLGVSALAQSPVLAKAERLELASNGCGDPGALAWAQSPSLASVRSLDFSQNDLTDVGVTALANSPHAANLRELELSINPFTSADALLKSPHLKKLTALKVYSVEFAGGGKAALQAQYGEDVVQG